MITPVIPAGELLDAATAAVTEVPHRDDRLAAEAGIFPDLLQPNEGWAVHLEWLTPGAACAADWPLAISFDELQGAYEESPIGSGVRWGLVPFPTLVRWYGGYQRKGDPRHLPLNNYCLHTFNYIPKISGAGHYTMADSILGSNDARLNVPAGVWVSFIGGITRNFESIGSCPYCRETINDIGGDSYIPPARQLFREKSGFDFKNNPVVSMVPAWDIIRIPDTAVEVLTRFNNALTRSSVWARMCGEPITCPGHVTEYLGCEDADEQEEQIRDRMRDASEEEIQEVLRKEIVDVESLADELINDLEREVEMLEADGDDTAGEKFYRTALETPATHKQGELFATNQKSIALPSVTIDEYNAIKSLTQDLVARSTRGWSIYLKKYPGEMPDAPYAIQAMLS